MVRQHKRMNAEVSFSTDRPNYTGSITLETGWVYLQDKNKYIPRESVEYVSSKGKKSQAMS